jgi:drug/metabolite transporter (DMT)-like permease
VAEPNLASKRAAVMATLLAAVCWGTSFPVIRWGETVGHLDPYTFAFFRFVAGAGLVVGIAASTRTFTGKLLRDRRVWLLGLLNAGAFSLQFLGQTMTTASNAALLVNVNVISVAFLSYLFLRERFGRAALLAVFIGLAGAVLVSTRGDFRGLGEGSVRGDLVVLGSGFVWALYAVATKSFVSAEVAMTDLLASVLIVTALVLGLPAALLGDLSPAAVTGKGWAAISYTAILPTARAFLLRQSGLRHISATVSAVLLTTEILVGVVISVAWLEEELTPIAVLGAVLILFAVVIASRVPEHPVASVVPPEA